MRHSWMAVLAAIGDLVLAGATWLGWSITGHSGIQPALAVLIVATPLAPLLAARLPVRVARRAGRRALALTDLDADALDALPRTSRLVIDTHRTVTTGHLVVTDVTAFDPENDRNLRWFAGALAHRADDPVSRAIAHLAGNGRITGFVEEPGDGISGSVDRHPVRVGADTWLASSSRGWSRTPGPTPAAGEACDAGTTVGVEVDHRPMGRITVADQTRRDAGRWLGELAETGIHPVLVSGAADRDVARIAELTGATEWYAATDADTVADKLGRGESGTLRSTASGTGEIVLPGGAVEAEDPSIGTAVGLLALIRRARRARTGASRLAWLAILVSAVLAAAGLLALPVAAVVAVVVLVAVALAVLVIVGGAADARSLE